MLKVIESVPTASREFERRIPKLRDYLGITRAHTMREVQRILDEACFVADVDLPQKKFQAVVNALLAA